MQQNNVYRPQKGLNEKVVQNISRLKNEPEWMLNFRLASYQTFLEKKMPTWGPDLSHINFDDLYYYVKPARRQEKSWEDVPAKIKKTFDRLGIPQAEQEFLAGVEAQYESEVVYGSLLAELADQGVIFLDTDTALKMFPEHFEEWFSKIIPPHDNKFAALNSAVWSGGSFVYIPKGVHIKRPLQAYFRINTKNMGQFERTLIIADEGSFVHYVEGCTAPMYSSDALHAAVVEIIVKKNARVRYTTIQNWSGDVYNLVTKRARVEENGVMEWVDGNLGCLKSGSTLITPEGVKNIENIKTDDRVLSYDEKTAQLCFRRVVEKRFSGMQKVHKISVGQREIYATSNHPFYTYLYDVKRPAKLGRYRFGYCRVDEVTKVILPNRTLPFGKNHMFEQPASETRFITKNQYKKDLEVRRVKSFSNKFPKESCEDIMWLLGLFVGDGNIDKQYGKTVNVVRWAKVGFSVPLKDRAHKKLVSIMRTLAPDLKYSTRKDGIISFWCSVQLAEFLERNGFIGGVEKKTIPPWVFSLPEDQRLAFLAGCIDSDGCLITSRNEFQIKSINKNLVDQLSKLLTTLGIFSYISKELAKEVKILGYKCKAKAAYTLHISVDERLFSYLSREFREKSKFIKKSQLIHHRLIGRSSICLPLFLEVRDVCVGGLSDDPVPTWDIEVEDTGNYICEGFIVHNSKLTMKYPSCYLVGDGARGEMLSIAYADAGKHQDTGAKMIHAAPNTSSKIISKSVSLNGGRTSYRGLVQVSGSAKNAKSKVECNALILDDKSASDTFPVMRINESSAQVEHEATVSKVGQEKMFYLMSRGLTKDEAMSLIVNGFIEPIVKELPLEYAVELNRLIELDMEGSVG